MFSTSSSFFLISLSSSHLYLPVPSAHKVPDPSFSTVLCEVEIVFALWLHSYCHTHTGEKIDEAVLCVHEAWPRCRLRLRTAIQPNSVVVVPTVDSSPMHHSPTHENSQNSLLPPVLSLFFSSISLFIRLRRYSKLEYFVQAGVRPMFNVIGRLGSTVRIMLVFRWENHPFRGDKKRRSLSFPLHCRQTYRIFPRQQTEQGTHDQASHRPRPCSQHF
jgi:hypothetical protein